jgi:hypothetical protein
MKYLEKFLNIENMTFETYLVLRMSSRKRQNG